MKICDNFGELTEMYQDKRLKMEYQYLWVIKDYQTFFSSCRHYGESPIFSMGQNNEYVLKLRIYLNGYNRSDYVAISPFLVNKDSHGDVKFCIEISSLDIDGQEQHTVVLILTKEVLNEPRGISQYFIERSDLSNNPNLLPEGELRILCRFFFDAPSTFKETIDLQYSQYYQKSQLDNFEQLYGSEEFSDFKLVIDKSEFPVHQAILATRSSVFKAMFLSNMRESKEKKVEIEDVDPEIMKKVLRYIYSGKVGNIQDIADQVLPVADKYQLDALKHICEDILIEQLSVENIYKMLEFSDNYYNAKNLKMRMLDFYKKNFEKFAAADDFKTTISSLPANLQTDIICALAKKN